VSGGRPRALSDARIRVLVERVRGGEQIKAVALEAGIWPGTLRSSLRLRGVDKPEQTPDPITLWEGTRVRDRALAVLEEKRRATRAELLDALDVPHQSLQYAVQQLVRDGCVLVAGFAPKTHGGNPAHVYEVAP